MNFPKLNTLLSVSLIIFGCNRIFSQCNCAGNLISVTNSGFESGTSGWTFSSNAVNTTQGGYEVCGNNYVWVIPNDGGVATITQQLTAANGIGTGKMFTFQFYGGSHDGSGQNKVRLEFFDVANVSLGFQEAPITNDVDITGVLQLYTLSMAGPANTSYAKIIGYAQGNGYLKLDQMCVTYTCTVNAGADVALPCAAGIRPSTYNLNQAATWTVLTQPVAMNALIDGNGNITNMNVSGNYVFRKNISGCTDDVRITVPVCVVPCPAVVCLPTVVQRN